MKVTEKKKWSEMNPEEKKKSKKDSLISLIIAIPIIIIVLNMCSDDYSKYNNLRSSVQSYADILLENQLKYPDDWEYESKAVTQSDSITYNFTAVVLAKNGFGVRGRLFYDVQMQFVGSKKDSYTDYSNPVNWNIVSNELTPD